ALEELLPDLPTELGGASLSALVRGVRWASLAVDVKPVRLRFVAPCRDGKTAVALQTDIDKVLKAVRKQLTGRREAADLDGLLTLLLPEVADKSLVREVDEKTLAAALRPAMVRFRSDADVKRSLNYLKQIGLALHSYHDVH